MSLKRWYSAGINLRQAAWACARCAGGHLVAHRGIEVGQVFFLGTKYSKPMGVTFLDVDGLEKPAQMGCYGIGVTRIVAAAMLAVWARRHLGRNWSGAITAKADHQLVRTGPYRWLRHPNYAVVIGEIAVVPLALGLPLYALIFSVLNAMVLAVRIRVEEASLAAVGAKPVP